MIYVMICLAVVVLILSAVFLSRSAPGQSATAFMICITAASIILVPSLFILAIIRDRLNTQRLRHNDARRNPRPMTRIVYDVQETIN